MGWVWDSVLAMASKMAKEQNSDLESISEVSAFAERGNVVVAGRNVEKRAVAGTYLAHVSDNVDDDAEFADVVYDGGDVEKILYDLIEQNS